MNELIRYSLPLSFARLRTDKKILNRRIIQLKLQFSRKEAKSHVDISLYSLLPVNRLQNWEWRRIWQEEYKSKLEEYLISEACAKKEIMRQAKLFFNDTISKS